MIVPHTFGPGLEEVWARAWELVSVHVRGGVEVLVRDDDIDLRAMVESAGLVAGESSSAAWLTVPRPPQARPLGAEYVLFDRSQRAGTPHPMSRRNGPDVAQRLAECPLYDPGLDLVVQTVNGERAGHSLYWFDPTTRVGLIEPVRVEDNHQRRGIAQAMLTAGIERLASRGAERVKIGFGSDAAASLYRSVGFRAAFSMTAYESRGAATAAR